MRHDLSGATQDRGGAELVGVPCPRLRGANAVLTPEEDEEDPPKRLIGKWPTK